MADVAKRRSAFISNILPSSSVTALEQFLMQELESSRHERGHLLKVIFPVSTSSPHVALATFQDEKAMVTLMRKRLNFEGALLTMQPFLSEVFCSMTAVINPDVMELFPFNSLDFSRLLEKRTAVECHRMDERDGYISSRRHASHTNPSEQLYVLTGNWYQLQNARKFLQEWVVDETNRSGFTGDGVRNRDERSVDVASPPNNDAVHERGEYPRANGSKESEHSIEQTRGLANETYQNSPRYPGDTFSGPNLETRPAAIGASESEPMDKKERSATESNLFRTTSRGESEGDSVPTFEGPSLKPEGSSSRDGLHIDDDNANLKLARSHRSNSSSTNSSEVEMPTGSPAFEGPMQHREPFEPLHPTSQNIDGVKSRDDAATSTPLDQELSMESTMLRTDDMRERSLASELRIANGDTRRDVIHYSTTGSTEGSTTYPEGSEDRLSVESSLDYMKYVKIPQTPPFSHNSDVLEHQFEDDLQRITSTNSDRDGEDTLLPRDDLERDLSEPPPSNSTITDGRIMDDDNEELVEGLGSLPVDPGVFSFILLKQSEPIREIEEKFGVKFSMHSTRDSDDSDVESAMLKITPTGATDEIAQAHDAFVDFYSHVFSILNHRVITTADMAIDKELLVRTVDIIHNVYKNVLLTVSDKKVLIYGLNETDVRMAKAWIVDTLKGSSQGSQSDIHRRNGEHSPTSGRVDSPSVKPVSAIRRDDDITEVDGQEVHSQIRGEIGGSPEEHKTDDIPLSGNRGRENDSKTTPHEGLDLPSADLEVDSGPQTEVDGRGLELSAASLGLTRPTARFEDEAVDYQHVGGPKRLIRLSTTSIADPVIPVVMPEVNRADNEVTDQDRSLIEGAASMTNIIPVDPGVFAFIQAQKHTVLCDIERNYGVEFCVKGDLNSDVYMVEVEPAGATSETASQKSKEAFVNFYHEVFSGLEHRVISLGDFKNISRDALEEIIQEMEHSFSDLLFRIVGSRVLIYGQGLHNVDSAKRLVFSRLRGTPASPGSPGPEPRLQFDDDMSLGSLSSDSMINRLNHLRYSSLSPEGQRAGQRKALSQTADVSVVDSLSSDSVMNSPTHLRYSRFQTEIPQAGQTQSEGLLVLNGLPMAERIDPSTTDAILNEGEYSEHLPSHHQLPSQMGGQNDTERSEQPKSPNGNVDLSKVPQVEQPLYVKMTPDVHVKPHGQNDSLVHNKDGDLNGTVGDVTFRFQEGCLILELSSGISVQIYCRDITRIRVEAIVNAANETLSNVGGVARAIRLAAGEVMQADCNRYVAHHGLLYPAKVVYTAAGNLPCKFVLHAVGPQWGDYPNKHQCRQTLRATIVKCLRTADEKLQVSSLAMPFISSGIFGIPLEVCVEEIFVALLDFNQMRLATPHGILQQVHIVDKDSLTVRQAQNSILETLGLKASVADERDKGMLGTVADENFSEHGAVGGGGSVSMQEENSNFPDAPLMNRDALRSGGHKRRGDIARLSRAQRRESSSSDEDVAYESVMYAQMDDYSLPTSPPAMVRSTSLPYLSRDDVDDAGGMRWAYKMSGSHASQSKDLKGPEYSVLVKKSGQAGERGRESARGTRLASKVSPKETSQEKKVRELLDNYSRAPPSPELSRKTQTEINRLLSEPERGAREKQPRPVRRTQSLDRSHPRQKCVVCSSPQNLSKRKSCEHLICEMCKRMRLDVGRCRECSKTKSKTQPEKKCDLCLCSTKNYLLDCRDCENSVCINCIKKGLDRCQSCLDRKRSLPDRHAEKKQPKLRDPIIGSRTSRIDTKRDYRIKTSVKESSVSTRRKPMLGLNQPLDYAASSYSNSAGSNGSVITQSAHHRHSAFSKEFVTEEAPHDEILRRFSREQEVKCQIFSKDTANNAKSVASDLHVKHRHSKKHASRTDKLEVVGQSSPPIARQQEAACVICLDKIKDPKTLKCKHTFCSACIEASFKFKPVCPICSTTYGKLQGDQPDGIMKYTTSSDDLPGHPGCGTIIINYKFPDGVQSAEHPNPGVPYQGTSRQAYFPNSKEGQEILKLLQKAFDARLLFTIGQSVTTGADNVVVWNDVHHKTRKTGGAERHGYPDPSYLQRVREELQVKGIK